MNIVRITDTSSSIKDRHLYRLIEGLDKFTLLECKNRRSILLGSPSETLILDHIDQATNPAEIIEQALKFYWGSKLFIIVDGNQHYELPLSKHSVSEHIVFLDDRMELSEPKNELAPRYFNHPSGALGLLKIRHNAA